MPLKQETQTELKNLIKACNDYEGRYYLLHLYEHFLKSNRSEDEVEPIAQHLINLIKNINDLSNPNLSLKEQFNAAMHISENYAALIKETGANGILYKTAQILLDLGGFIIGLCTAVFGAALGAVSIGLEDIRNFRLPTGLFIGAIVGLLAGFMLGQRVPHSLFKEEETRLIRHTVNKLQTTFKSLFQSVEHDHTTDIKQDILRDYFSGNQEEFNRFLVEKQPYEILSVQASFFSAKLKGSVGHHSLIKFTINENYEQPKLIEMGLPSDQETEFSQQELRETTGEQLVKMLVMNKILHPQYTRSAGTIFGILTPYQPGINDCNTYIDKILFAAGESESQTKRFTHKDTIVSQLFGCALKFFKPVPDKLGNFVLAEKNIDEDTKNNPAQV